MTISPPALENRKRRPEPPFRIVKLNPESIPAPSDRSFLPCS
jgi:hypothetical protein